MLYKKYPSCLITIGAARSIIVDLNRSTHYPIPDFLAQILLRNFIDFDQVKNEFDMDEEKQIIQEYVEFLTDEDLIFEVAHEDEANCFTAYSMEFASPNLIHNMTWEISPQNLPYLNKVTEEINALRIPHIQFSCFTRVDMHVLANYLNNFIGSSITSIELVLLHQEDQLQEMQALLKNNKIIKIILHGAGETKVSEQDFRLAFVAQQLHSNLHCGAVNSIYFTPNAFHFTESQHHNTCLNGKISVDANGEIKNCPGMINSYGNISDTSLLSVADTVNFQKLWNIKKDEITKCKDCEFRHICTDCRAFIDSPEDIYSAPLKCGYNPYTCEWEDWSTNPLKQNAIGHYGMHAILPKSKNVNLYS